MNRGINGDISDELFDIFSHADDVTVMHPMGGRQVGRPEVRAANIFRRENGVWKLVHHHANHMPDVPTALQSAAEQAG